MPSVQSILHFIGQVQGGSAGPTTTLGRQVIAVLAVASVNRFAPRVSMAAMNNPWTRAGANYVARHPLAALTAYAFASYTNSSVGEQWFGSFTRAAQTAALTPVFAHAGSILSVAARPAGYFVRPGIVNVVAGSFRLMRQIPLPRAPLWIVNNFATRRFVRFLSRHPAALLASYFTAQFINNTFAPRWLGPFTQDIIAGSLVPVFVYSPGVLPRAIRAAGTGAYYGSRATASALEFLLAKRATKVVVPRPGARSGQLSAPALGAITVVALEAWNFNERLIAEAEGVSPPWYAAFPGEGFLLGGAGLSSVYLLERFPRAIPAAGSFVVRQYARIATILSRSPAFLRYLVNVKFLPAFPRAAAAIIQASWAATAILKGLVPLELMGLKILPTWATQSLVAVTSAGFPATLFRTGTLRGAGVEVGSWFAVVWNAVRHPTVFVRHEIEGIGRVVTRLGIPAALRASASFSRSSLPVVRTALTRAIPLGGLAWRTLGGPVGIGASAADVLLALELESQDQNFIIEQLTERIWSRINYLRDLERQGIYTGPWTATIFHTIMINTQDRRPRARIQALTNSLDYVESLFLNTPSAAQYQNLGNILEGTVQGFAALAQNAGNFLDRVSTSTTWQNLPRQQQLARGNPRPSSWPRDQWGQFLWRTLSQTTVARWLPQGLDEVLTYINKIFDAARTARAQAGSAGVAIHGGAIGAETGHRGRNFWLFRGRDRNLLLQTLRDMLALEERDALEESGKTTAKISVREPILPDEVAGLAGAVIVIIRAMKYDASLVRNRGATGGFYPVEYDN